MTNGKLGDRLLQQNENGSVSAAEVTSIVDRERSRVRRWLIASVALWTITAAYLLVLGLGYAVFIHPRLDQMLFSGESSITGASEVHRVTILGLKALLWWPALFLLAGVGTTAAIVASRRATLRQIQHSLAEISRQLADLRHESKSG